MVKNPPANAGDTGPIPDPGIATCHEAANKPVHQKKKKNCGINKKYQLEYSKVTGFSILGDFVSFENDLNLIQ